VLSVLPEAAEIGATFTPLAPFSKIIGKVIQQIVDAMAKRRKLWFYCMLDVNTFILS
jgi:hypothetical protein